jgi:hypothetical protein
MANSIDEARIEHISEVKVVISTVIGLAVPLK